MRLFGYFSNLRANFLLKKVSLCNIFRYENQTCVSYSLFDKDKCLITGVKGENKI